VHVVLLFVRVHLDGSVEPHTYRRGSVLTVLNLLFLDKVRDICGHLTCLQGSLLSLLYGRMLPHFRHSILIGAGIGTQLTRDGLLKAP
jgi:hypothetical protein